MKFTDIIRISFSECRISKTYIVISALLLPFIFSLSSFFFSAAFNIRTSFYLYTDKTNNNQYLSFYHIYGRENAQKDLSDCGFEKVRRILAKSNYFTLYSPSAATAPFYESVHFYDTDYLISEYRDVLNEETCTLTYEQIKDLSDGEMLASESYLEEYDLKQGDVIQLNYKGKLFKEYRIVGVYSGSVQWYVEYLIPINILESQLKEQNIPITESFDCFSSRSTDYIAAVSAAEKLGIEKEAGDKLAYFHTFDILIVIMICFGILFMFIGIATVTTAFKMSVSDRIKTTAIFSLLGMRSSDVFLVYSIPYFITILWAALSGGILQMHLVEKTASLTLHYMDFEVKINQMLGWGIIAVLFVLFSAILCAVLYKRFTKIRNNLITAVIYGEGR